MRALSALSVGRKWALAATALVMVSLVAVAGISGRSGSPTSSGHDTAFGSRPTVTSAPPPAGAGSLTSQQRADLQQSLARMRAQSPVAPATSAQYPGVSSQARVQPDLYAAAFTRRLLTQDYRTSRDQLLAWVQSESAPSTEPLVVGLTPVELQPRLALWSVQDDAGGPAPVPSQATWAGLAQRQGHTTVHVQKVSEPVAWAGAVANGEISDPGSTCRQIDAEVTLHTLDNGQPADTRYSVALTIQLEGPPARGGYGFVAAVIYNVAAIS